MNSLASLEMALIRGQEIGSIRTKPFDQRAPYISVAAGADALTDERGPSSLKPQGLKHNVLKESIMNNTHYDNALALRLITGPVPGEDFVDVR
jgi:hypothetical protein